MRTLIALFAFFAAANGFSQIPLTEIIADEVRRVDSLELYKQGKECPCASVLYLRDVYDTRHQPDYVVGLPCIYVDRKNARAYHVGMLTRIGLDDNPLSWVVVLLSGETISLWDCTDKYKTP
jgi:hypothetical protein